MDVFLMTPFALGTLVTLCLQVPLVLYLLSIRRKSAATWWLVLSLAGLVLSDLSYFIRTWVYWPAEPVNWEETLFRVSLFAIALGLWAYLQFAYAFLGNPFPREARLVRWVSSGLGLGLIGLIVYSYYVPVWTVVSLRFLTLLGVGFFVGAVVVFLRKWRRARREAGRESDRAAAAYRTFVVLTGLPLLGILLTIVPSTFGLALPGGLLFMGQMAFLVFTFALVVAYVNYSPEPTTFQAKLVGLTLVAVLGAFAAVTLLLFPEEEVVGGAPVQAGQTIRFAPDAGGGYQLNHAALPYEAERGDDLNLGDDDNAALALPFRFPFGGRMWDSLYVSANGAVAFAGPMTRGDSILYNSAFFYDARPKIAPLYADLDASAGGGVYARSDSSRVLISWHDVPRFGAAGTRNRVQLALHRSGAIDMVYDRVEIPNVQFYYGLRGLVAGESVPELSTASWEEQLPLALAAGANHVEDFDLAQRQHFHEATRDLAWLVVGATLFILLVFPFFFRSSLVRPLDRLREGVQRVNAGDLETEVPVGVRDEIGYLTHHFNRMTQSLRRYSGEMEALVEERTAALNRSLEELKAAQQQLVHSEKMASLGALTAGIAHEIKNPLNFVNNFAQLSKELADELRHEIEALDPHHDAERIAEIKAILGDLETNAAKIEEHGRRADAIVRSMMQHARGGSGHRERVDLNTFVDEYVDLAWHGRRAQQPDFNVDLVRDHGEGLGTVEVVPQDLGRVLINLLNNAFDAVSEQKARLDGQYAPRVRVVTRRSGDEVQIRVADNGGGIPGEVREKIFEPFFTTKPTGSGTGLGLSMSYDIVRQGHGGTLSVESVPGEGATFILALPVRDPVDTLSS